MKRPRVDLFCTTSQALLKAKTLWPPKPINKIPDDVKDETDELFIKII